MTGQPWGRTGRVTIYGEADQDSRDGEISDVLFEGDVVGWIGAPDERSRWWAIVGSERIGHCNFDVPSIDDAVMDVLRRTRPDVWRAERPVVVRARGHTYRDVPDAVSIAHRLARAEYAVKAYR